MKKLTHIIAFICLIIAFAACQNSKKSKNFNDKTTLDDQGLKFITNAHEAGITEINAANIAEKNSNNQRVINFAKMMVTDHTSTGSKLDTIAADNFVTVADTLTTEHKLMLADLSKKTGNTFDKAYMQMMITDHKKAVDMFKHVNENKSAALQNFANKTLPTLNAHLDSAKAIITSLK